MFKNVQLDKQMSLNEDNLEKLVAALFHKKLIRGATAPKSQDRLKRLLPDGSIGGLVVCKVLIPQP